MPLGHFLSDHNSLEWFPRLDTKPLRVGTSSFPLSTSPCLLYPLDLFFFAPNSLIILLEIMHKLIHRSQRVLVEIVEKLGSSLDEFPLLKLQNKYYLPNGSGRV